jgi:ADP-heptose:LPS heptosyltransferase
VFLHRELLALSPPEPAHHRPTVLVLRALGLGDLLTAVPALRALRGGLPGYRIVLAAPPALRPLLPLTRAVDDLLPVHDFGELAAQTPPPALAVNLHGRGPQSIDAIRRTGAARLISHRHPDRPEVAGPDWVDGLHERRRWAGLLTWAGFDAPPDDLALPRPPADSAAPGAIVVHPGAAFPARRWPPERYAAVARALATDHRVVVTGGPTERTLAAEVTHRAGLPPTAALTSLDLTGLAALVAEASMVVCGDTGIAHLASAYATPSVVLFGPTPPALWGPPEDGPHTVLWRGVRGDPHGETVAAGLLRIEVDDVLEAVTTAHRR